MDKTLTQIVAIMLVRNEDKFLRRAALNIIGFCDRILIADHQSQDGTAEICEELAPCDLTRISVFSKHAYVRIA